MDLFALLSIFRILGRLPVHQFLGQDTYSPDIDLFAIATVIFPCEHIDKLWSQLVVCAAESLSGLRLTFAHFQSQIVSHYVPLAVCLAQAVSFQRHLFRLTPPPKVTQLDIPAVRASKHQDVFGFDVAVHHTRCA